MGHSFDFFVAELECLACGNVSPASCSTNMQTYIRDEPEMANLTVGSPLVVNIDAMEGCNYFTIQRPFGSEPIRILDTWECPTCGKPFNWAEIVVHRGIITSITAVPLNRETLDRAHFIADDAKGVTSVLTDIPYDQLRDKEVVQLLKHALS